jgi:tetraacyldisaccharide 4'-kinase
VSDYHAIISGARRGCLPVLLRSGLRAASGPYSGAMRVRNWLYDGGWKRSVRAEVPVISVGNLTLGGTGKTPCVEYIARRLRERDVRVAILSRGYGGAASPNDEALVLEENLPDVPHLLGADRVHLARVAVAELDSEVLLLDDGFQHRRLARDLDIVLLDATNPWGYGYVFPRGLMREAPAGLRRAGAVLLTRCDQVDSAAVEALRESVRRVAPDVPIFDTVHRPTEWISSERRALPLEALAGQPMAAFCGVGNPEAFRRTLFQLGVSVVAFRSFPDHHAYTAGDVEDLRQWLRRLPDDGVAVSTQKDLVKLRLTRLGDRDLWALRIQLEVVSDATRLDQRLWSVCSP